MLQLVESRSVVAWALIYLGVVTTNYKSKRIRNRIYETPPISFNPIEYDNRDTYIYTIL